MRHTLGNPSRPARPLSCRYASRLAGASQWTTLRMAPLALLCCGLPLIIQPLELPYLHAISAVCTQCNLQTLPQACKTAVALQQYRC